MGKVGAGKSSLLSAVTAELQKLGGKVGCTFFLESVHFQQETNTNLKFGVRT